MFIVVELSLLWICEHIYLFMKLHWIWTNKVCVCDMFLVWICPWSRFKYGFCRVGSGGWVVRLVLSWGSSPWATCRSCSSCTWRSSSCAAHRTTGVSSTMAWPLLPFSWDCRRVSELVDIQPVLWDQVPIVRRFSGGGTSLLIGERWLWLSFATRMPLPGCRFMAKNLTDLVNFICVRMTMHLVTRKFGGNAQSITKNRWVHHTSFLWDYDVKNMDYLKIPKRAPEYRLARNHRFLVPHEGVHTFAVSFHRWGHCGPGRTLLSSARGSTSSSFRWWRIRAFYKAAVTTGPRKKLFRPKNPLTI